MRYNTNKLFLCVLKIQGTTGRHYHFITGDITGSLPGGLHKGRVVLVENAD